MMIQCVYFLLFPDVYLKNTYLDDSTQLLKIYTQYG